MNNRNLVSQLLFAMIICATMAGFTAERSIQAFANRIEAQMEAEHTQAMVMAQQYGWPVRITTADGVTLELQGLVNGRPLYYTTHNLEAGRTISTDKIWPSGKMGYAMNGKTQTIAMWEGGDVSLDHQEFGHRVQQKDSGLQVTTHATHVAGTLIAAGVVPAAQGMAFQAQLHAYDWTNDLAEMAAAAAKGLALSNHSYGPQAGWVYDLRKDGRWVWFGATAFSEKEDYLFGYYLERARQWDECVFQAPDYLIVATAGNDRSEYGPPSQIPEHWVLQGMEWVLSTNIRDMDGGADGYDSINGFAVAKNVLTVGGVQALPWTYSSPSDVRMTNFSSWGPTDDGRIKPDIVADAVHIYSCSFGTDIYATLSGTSQAAPSITGSVALLKEHYGQLWGNKIFKAATLKALVIHTARESGLYPGPDYQFGWGLMNTAKAASVISEDFDNGGNSYIREATLNNGSTLEFTIQSDGQQPLAATLCWTDPPGPIIPPALNSTTPTLVNDLDLRIMGPFGSAGAKTWSPWVLDPQQPALAATTGDNTRDNVEQIIIPTPEPGTYTVHITHKKALLSGSQSLSLILTGSIKSTIPAPLAPVAVAPLPGAAINADSIAFQWTSAATASSYLFQVSRDVEFKSIYFQQEDIRTTQYALNNLPAQTTLFWRVRGRNGGGEGLFSQARSFTIGEMGAISVWEKISPLELNYQVTAIITNNKGYIFSVFTPLSSIPNFLQILGTYCSSDSGITWKKIAVNFSKLKTTSTGSIFAVAGSVIEMGETGKLNNQIFNLPDASAQDIYIDEHDHIYVLCYDGRFFYSDNFGKTWIERGKINLKAGNNTQSLSGFRNVLYAATWGNGAFCSTDSGKTWQTITAGLTETYIYCVAAGLNNTLLLGTVSGLYTSPVDTIKWSKQTKGEIATSKVFSITIGKKGAVFANSYGCQGPGDGVFVSLDHGANWTTVNEGLSMTSSLALYKVPDGDLFLGLGTGDPGDGGAVFRGSENKALQSAARKLAMSTPGTVVLSNPIPNSIHNTFSVPLQWNVSQYSAMYRIQIATTADFSTLVQDAEIAGMRFVADHLKPGFTYFWRVRGLNAVSEGPWSVAWKFQISTTTLVEEENANGPNSFGLHQNYPNPFNQTTFITFDLPQTVIVQIHVYDLTGAVVATLFDGIKTKGQHRITWNGRTQNGNPVASGVYYFTMRVVDSRTGRGTFFTTRKMILLK